MPRFVLLKHTTPQDAARATHWDLMLECDGVLQTWALEAEPADGIAVDAVRLHDHRLEYLDYEGEISGDRGHVARCDRGTFAMLAVEAHEIQVLLSGVALSGKLTLTRLDNAQRWRVLFVSGSDAVEAASC